MKSVGRCQAAVFAPVVAGSISTLAWAVLAWRPATLGSSLATMLAVVGIAWAALAIAMRTASAAGPAVVLGFAAAFRAIGLSADPVMEDDHWRFLWDGYRFAAIGNPYAEAPQARFMDDTIPPEFRVVLDRINYPEVPTVYGPATQWAFRASHALAPAQLWPWKLILLAAEATILALLWSSLGARGRLLLAWCPLAVFETGFNAHPDVLAIAPVVAAWWLGQRSRPVLAGAAAGFAVAAKVFAVPIVPFVLWRSGHRAWSAAAAAVGLLYLPFWARGSAADLAGLRAMAGEWEFNSGIYAVVALVSSAAAARTICGLAFIGLWSGLLARWARSEATHGKLPPGEWVFGAFLLFSATVNPWYCLWLWPFVAARVSATGVCALAAVSLAYVTGLNLGDASLGNFEHPAWLRPMEFAILAFGALRDWRQRKRPVA